MDLVETFRVFGRHRVLTSLLLLLTLAGIAGAAVKLPWTYKSVAVITLLSSKAASESQGDGNPYLAFDDSLTQTANVVALELTNPDTVRTLATQGDSASYQAEVLSENEENEDCILGKTEVHNVESFHEYSTILFR